jgi:hypothetical protein
MKLSEAMRQNTAPRNRAVESTGSCFQYPAFCRQRDAISTILEVTLSSRSEANAVMGEFGIDIFGHRSKEAQQFDYVVTVCDDARETCTMLFGATQSCIKTLNARRPQQV